MEETLIRDKTPGVLRRFASRLTVGGAFGLIVLMLVIFAAVFADQISPHDPMKNRLIQKLRPPVGERAADSYYLGTDHMGRDILSRLIFGARPTFYIPFLAMLISLILGSLIGIVAGLGKGCVDDLLMRITDILLSIPFILIIIAVIAGVGRSTVPIVIIVLGVTGWAGYARLIRSEVLSLREQEFIQAGTAQGARLAHKIFKHIVPNIIPTLIVISTVHLSQLVLIEAALSFIGLGIPPGSPSWGGMLADGRNHVFTAWWYATFPGVAITIYVLGINLIGDWLRDVLDPRLRSSI